MGRSRSWFGRDYIELEVLNVGNYRDRSGRSVDRSVFPVRRGARRKLNSDTRMRHGIR